MNQLACKIRQLRRQLCMSQEQLAATAGIVGSMVCKIETGKAKPSLGTLEKIAAVLGTTASRLLDEDAEEELAATRAG